MDSSPNGDGMESELSWIYRGYEVLSACLIRWQENAITPGVPPSDEELSAIATDISGRLFQDLQLLPEEKRFSASREAIEGILFMVMKALNEQHLIGPVSEN